MAHATASRPVPYSSERSESRLPRGFIVAGILLGVGLGGFIDGIVLHQVLQWHHMLTATGDHPAHTVSGLETNTLWDGLFHSLTWVATVCGLYALWISAPVHRPGWGWVLVGLIGIGWGLFNLVEGVIDHHILQIHHVRDDVAEPLPWDLGFLALGAMLIALGAWIARRAAAVPTTTH